MEIEQKLIKEFYPVFNKYDLINIYLGENDNRGEYSIEIKAILYRIMEWNKNKSKNGELKREDIYEITREVFDYYFSPNLYDINRLKEMSNELYQLLNERFGLQFMTPIN